MYRKHGLVRISGYSDSGYAGDRDKKYITGYCTFVGGNLGTWRSKKKDVVSRSNVEVEYTAMVHAHCFKYRPIYRYIGRDTSILFKTIR